MRKSKKEAKCEKFQVFLRNNNISVINNNYACLLVHRDGYRILHLEFKSHFVKFEYIDLLNISNNAFEVKHYIFENYWYDKIVNIIKDLDALDAKYSKLGEPDDIEYEIRRKKLNFIEKL